jgi:hypothetical protein
MPDEVTLDKGFAQLQACLAQNDEQGVQDAIYGLGAINNDWVAIPDEVVERILAILRSEGMLKSQLARHLLNFFEFESLHLSDRQKWLCIGFLNEYGDKFENVLTQQVVGELRFGRYGDYLKLKKPNAQQWKDYQKMQGERE